MNEMLVKTAIAEMITKIEIEQKRELRENEKLEIVTKFVKNFKLTEKYTKFTDNS